MFSGLGLVLACLPGMARWTGAVHAAAAAPGGAVAGLLSAPEGVAVDRAGNIYIADSGRDRVLKVAPSGAQTTLGHDLAGPEGLAVDAGGTVYVADSGHHRVLAIAPGGAQRTVVGGLTSPVGVAVSAAGTVYVVDSDHVVRVTTGGARTVLGQDLNLPIGVAVDAAGVLYVLDRENDRVVTIGRDGTQSVFATGLYGAAGLAVDRTGNVYVAVTDEHKVLKARPTVPASRSAMGCRHPASWRWIAPGTCMSRTAGWSEWHRTARRASLLTVWSSAAARRPAVAAICISPTASTIG